MKGISAGVTFQGVDPPDAFIKNVRQVEDWGYDYLWVTDSSMHARDVYVYMTLAAVNSKRLRLGTNCTHPHTRHPAINVNAIVTINEISGGRAILGIGAGDSPVHELGFPIAKVAELAAMVEIARRLHTGERFDYKGPHFEMRAAGLHHGLQGVAPPKVYITASGPRMLELAGEVADGVIVHCGAFKEGLEFALMHVRQGAEKAGRRIEDIDVAWQLFGVLEDDLDAARNAARPIAASTTFRSPVYAELAGVPKALVEQIRAVYSGGEFHEARAAHALTTNEMVDKLTVAGPPDVWLKRFELARSLGVTHVEIFALGDRLKLYGDIATRVLKA
jgi:5,10-methylenetetrahydromethanopterin reductase